ncbi:hypothetical protein TSUD_237340 [Trifolium subterraneum]|uniref:EngC GTPase domain-containing protein n=1 Tax=Trifolium subterraneum TaxID=3900 RepID=A0A2Z6NYE3_TRISU|nr:hypothetical protein TSUD_237340 [Trifolium subterraneum]
MGEREGVIVNAPRSDFFKVSLKPVSHCNKIWCSIRRPLNNSPKVGDNVIVELADTKNGRIKKLLNMEREISYPLVANINQQVLVFSVEDDLDSHITSRFLVEAESHGVEMTMVLTKTDLVHQKSKLK